MSQLISSGEEDGTKVAAMKPIKQTVTYDSSTGKMYEELGSAGSGAGEQNRSCTPVHCSLYCTLHCTVHYTVLINSCDQEERGRAGVGLTSIGNDNDNDNDNDDDGDYCHIYHSYQPSYSGVTSVYPGAMQVMIMLLMMIMMVKMMMIIMMIMMMMITQTPAQYMASQYSSPSYVGPYDR